MCAGHPDPVHFPGEALLASAKRVLQRDPMLLQYGHAAGSADLRNFIIGRVQHEDGRVIGQDEVMVTSGCKHAIALLFEAFADRGDTVIMENPVYSAFFPLLSGRGVNIATVPMDHDGMRVNELERCVAELSRGGKAPKVVYTIPTFQNPTGTEMSVEKRKRLVELAAQWGFVVIEDVTYQDIRFEGDALPSLYSLDTSGFVVKVGSFSKTVAPGLRLGFVCGERAIVSALASLRTDLGNSPWLTATLADYLSEGRFDQRVKYLQTFYRSKRDHMLSALEKHCAPLATWQTPRGGFFFWLKTDPRIDAKELLLEARKNGLDYNPGTDYHVDGFGHDRLRLVFANVTFEQIDTAVAVLGQALRYCAKADRDDTSTRSQSKRVHAAG